MLHQSQLDSIELAGLDCDFEFETYTPGTPITPQTGAQTGLSLYLCSVSDYEVLRAHPDLYPQKDIILIHRGQNEAIRAVLSTHGGPRFTVGASAPGILRGLIGSILEFRIGAGSRGLLPRLSNVSSMEFIERKLTASSQRSEVQQEVLTFCKDELRKRRDSTSQGTSQYAKAISDMLDEMLMNAIWDANPLITDSDRRSKVDLDPSRTVTVRCSCDGSNLCITVEDKQGTFPFSALDGPLAFALGLKPDIQVRNGPGGAGLGLFMVMQKTSILTFEVKPGQFTRVSALLRLDESVREMQGKPKSILVFDQGMAETPVSSNHTEGEEAIKSSAS
jgi:hypothetical protein